MKLPLQPPLHRPTGIKIGVFLSWFVVIFSTIVLLTTLLGVGTFEIEEEEVSAAEFLSAVWLDLTINILVLGSVIVLLRRKFSQARFAMAFYWLCLGARELGDALRPMNPDDVIELTWLLAFLVSCWYLFGRQNVTRYFKNLEASAVYRTKGFSVRSCGCNFS